jgi:hypothetical protein
MEGMIRAVLSSEHEASLKLQLVAQVLKHSRLTSSEAESLWFASLGWSVNGPTSHRAGALAVINHLQQHHCDIRNRAILMILKAFSDIDIDFESASELILTLDHVRSHGEQQRSEGWGISAPLPSICRFADICCQHDVKWTSRFQIAIARIWTSEGLVCRAAHLDKAASLFTTAISWLLSAPAGKTDSYSALIVFINAMSRGASSPSSNPWKLH